MSEVRMSMYDIQRQSWNKELTSKSGGGYGNLDILKEFK